MTKVKGHATDADVEQGRVRLEDKLGNAKAGAAADLGVHCIMLVIIGIPLCCSFIGS